MKPFVYALEMIENPGYFVCARASLGAATVLTFETQAAAEKFYWAQECLLVLGTKITRL